MPKAKRTQKDHKSYVPGSGKYEYKTFIGEGPKYTMRPKYGLEGIMEEKRNPNAFKKTANPGPGKYDIADNNKGPRYTIGLRRDKSSKDKDDRSKSTPGVGTYNLRREKSFVAPCYKFDHEQRDNLSLNHTALKYPAPNKYKYLDGSESKGPKYSFPKSARFGGTNKQNKKKEIKNETPGPGAYSMKRFIGFEGPKYSFVHEALNHADPCDESYFKKIVNYPCPGTYIPKIAYVSDTPAYTISHVKRGDPTNLKNMNFPGPEKYNPNKFVSSTVNKFPVWSMGKANKDEDAPVQGSKKKRSETPGPGKYDSKCGLIGGGPHYSMAEKFKEKKPADFPGPGQYKTVVMHLHNEPKYSIGKELRDDEMKLVKKNNYPAPSKYTVKDSKHTGEISFPKDKKLKEQKAWVPGPGAYRIPTAFDYISNLTREGGAFDPTFRYV